jgi:hypothetical protein
MIVKDLNHLHYFSSTQKIGSKIMGDKRTAQSELLCSAESNWLRTEPATCNNLGGESELTQELKRSFLPGSLG